MCSLLRMLAVLHNFTPKFGKDYRRETLCVSISRGSFEYSSVILHAKQTAVLVRAFQGLLALPSLHHEEVDPCRPYIGEYGGVIWISHIIVFSQEVYSHLKIVLSISAWRQIHTWHSTSLIEVVGSVSHLIVFPSLHHVKVDPCKPFLLFYFKFFQNF